MGKDNKKKKMINESPTKIPIKKAKRTPKTATRKSTRNASKIAKTIGMCFFLGEFCFEKKTMYMEYSW